MKSISILIILSLSAVLAQAEPAPTEEKVHLLAKADRPVAENFKLRDLAGKSHSLTDFKGKVVVISFWATWCKPCLRELSFLKKLKAKHPDQLEILAVATDGPNTASRIRPVSIQKKLTMPILLDADGSVMASMNARGILPQSNYIDFGGKLAYAHDGFVAGDEVTITEVIEALLKEKQP